MSESKAETTHNPKDEAPEGALAKLPAQWRVTKDELGDPRLDLWEDLGFVYEIGPKTLGVWFNRGIGHRVRLWRRKWGRVDLRQEGDYEGVIAWPADDPRTPELLEWLRAKRRRQVGKAERRRLAKMSRKHSPLRPGRLKTRASPISESEINPPNERERQQPDPEVGSAGLCTMAHAENRPKDRGPGGLAHAGDERPGNDDLRR